MAKRSVEVILKYRFSNRKLLDKALLPAGAPASNKHIQGEAEGNKRLALLGDSVLQEAVLGPWYNSKESTTQRSGISNCIAKIPCQQGQVPQKTAASTVEALVGAVYLDCGKDISKVMQVLEAIGFFTE
ncbi:hypothetical protein GGP41_007879 [Bipolaris sorokiniana]|uniref:RNase III domain-containing protein n=1 Tax=Cochliobolus sativus TaxID=45130 RepID=A0A8H5ZNS1_COCSA|nr:hypothetical protein GGP41_007879 [Bipolaris sorokiniana]